MARGAAIGAEKDRGAVDERLSETLSAAGFEGALEKVSLPAGSE